MLNEAASRTEKQRDARLSAVVCVCLCAFIHKHTVSISAVNTNRGEATVSLSDRYIHFVC